MNQRRWAICKCFEINKAGNEISLVEYMPAAFLTITSMGFSESYRWFSLQTPNFRNQIIRRFSKSHSFSTYTKFSEK